MTMKKTTKRIGRIEKLDRSREGGLIEGVDTYRNVQVRSEVFKVPSMVEKAMERTDAFAKEISAKTFLWLVRRINDATCAENNYTRLGNSASAGTSSSSSRRGLKHSI